MLVKKNIFTVTKTVEWVGRDVVRMNLYFPFVCVKTTRTYFHSFTPARRTFVHPLAG